MDQTLLGVIEILGPAVLLVVLIWLAMRGRSNRGSSAPEQKTEQATDRLYKEESSAGARGPTTSDRRRASPRRPGLV